MKKQDISVNDYWEVRRDGVPLAGGPKSTFPNNVAEPRNFLLCIELLSMLLRKTRGSP